jgi:hypothetical protein
MHRRRGLTATIIGVLALALGLAAVAGTLAAKKKTVKATAQMNGVKEVDNAGNPSGDMDGSGTADFKLKKKKKQVCFDIDFQNIQDPFVAHIHPGKAGVNGEPLITLFEDTALTSPQEGCVRAAKSDIKDIIERPKSFYVNIHNDEFPLGAIRGQLKKTRGGGSGGGSGGGGGGVQY